MRFGLVVECDALNDIFYAYLHDCYPDSDVDELVAQDPNIIVVFNHTLNLIHTHVKETLRCDRNAFNAEQILEDAPADMDKAMLIAYLSNLDELYLDVPDYYSSRLQLFDYVDGMLITGDINV